MRLLILFSFLYPSLQKKDKVGLSTLLFSRPKSIFIFQDFRHRSVCLLRTKRVRQNWKMSARFECYYPITELDFGFVFLNSQSKCSKRNVNNETSFNFLWKAKAQGEKFLCQGLWKKNLWFIKTAGRWVRHRQSLHYKIFCKAFFHFLKVCIRPEKWRN